MLIVTMPSIMRCHAAAAVAPVTTELPGLVTHVAMTETSDGSGAVVRVGSLPNLPATNPQRIDLNDPTKVASISAAGLTMANFATGKHLRIKGNPAGAANNQDYFLLGRGGIEVQGRVYIPSGLSNDRHTIITAGGETFTGWRLYIDRTDGGSPTLGVTTQDHAANTNTLVGPSLTFDTLWTFVFKFNPVTRVTTLIAMQGSDTELSASSSPLSERTLNFFQVSGINTAVYIGGSNDAMTLNGYLCDLYVAKFGLSESPWDVSLNRHIHNNGVPRTFATAYTAPTPNSPEPSGKPFSNVQTAANWLNTTTTGTKGLYWFKANRMPSSGCRFFWSTDHIDHIVNGPAGVYTATSSGPTVAPTVFTQITGIPVTGSISGSSIDMPGSVTYRHSPGDGLSEPHHLHVNFICPPPQDESSGEKTYVFSSATEDFATVTVRGHIAPPVVRFNWLGYETTYSSVELPFLGAGEYISTCNKDLAGGASIWTPSTSPISHPVGAANSTALDHVTVFPARCQASWRNCIFTPDNGVRYYAVARCDFPTGRGIGVIELALVTINSKQVLQPTGKLWQLGTLNTDVYPTAGYTQEIACLWESGVLYVYRMMGFYPEILYEQIDLITCDFPA
jgi:hypothetical protein